MSRPTIGVWIPTPGRTSLIRTLNSIVLQGIEPGDDFLVVGDGFHQPTKDIVDLFGSPFRYIATQRTRDWGHSQSNYGIKHVRGDWVIPNDDDDIFAPRAFDEIRHITSKVETPRIIAGRVLTPFLGLLWKEPGVEPFDGHMLVVPNDKKKLGYFGLEYAGDQKWIKSNFEAYDTISWADRVWALTRQKMKLWPRLSPHPMHKNTFDEVWYNFHRDEGGLWQDTPLFLLHMWRDGDHWLAELELRPRLVEIEEYEEAVQWATWAAQGSDVWFRIKQDHIGIKKALLRSGYRTHIENEEYTFDWPPNGKFEPVEEIE